MQHKKYFALGLTIAGIGIGAFAVDNLVAFNPGSSIKSSEVNQNFNSLRTATASLESFNQAILSGGCNAGEAVASIGPSGKVNCIALGGGGTTPYTAGAGLALGGNQFSIAAGGVDAAKLADGAVGASKIGDGAVGLNKISPAGGSNGQVLKLVGGAVTWATDATSGGGTGGLTSVNVASPLSGDGTSASPINIADSALLGAKLANSSVGLSKLDSAVNQKFDTLAELSAFRSSIASGPCKASEAMASIETSGKVNCIAVGSGGTTYSAGAGLALTGNVFAIANAGVGSAQIAAGAVQLSKLDLAGSAGSGKFLGYNGSKLEWQNDSFAFGTAVSGDNSTRAGLTVNQNSVNGSAIWGQSNGDTATGIMGVAPNGTGVFGSSTNLTGVYGQSNERIGVHGVSVGTAEGTAGVFGESVSLTGKAVGVLGLSRSYFGVSGYGVGPSGLTGGVFGEATNSPVGTGVVGHGGVTGGFFEAKGGPSGGFNPVGVYGSAFGSIGTGVVGKGSALGGYFQATAANGRGLVINTTSSDSTLRLEQGGGGPFIAAWVGGSRKFDVNNDGDVSGRSFQVISDRNAKTNIKPISPSDVLSKVSRLPIASWNYKDDPTSLKHIGPMAQDFHATFGLNGSEDKRINQIDVQGIALAAIQGLDQKLEAKEVRIAELENQLKGLEARLARLEKH